MPAVTPCDIASQTPEAAVLKLLMREANACLYNST
jgi:hypothetical protein